jgi:hypothetical protein
VGTAIVPVNHETARLLEAWRSADRAAFAAHNAAESARHAADAADEARRAAESFAELARKALIENTAVSESADGELKQAIDQALRSRTASDDAA